MPGEKRQKIGLTVILILFFDQLTKHLVKLFLLPGDSLPIIKGIFHLSLVHNRGAAFGILKNQLPFFIFSSIAAIILILVNLKDQGNKAYSFSLSLILAGALGNLIDRLYLGYVIDFLDFRIWPVFNIADSAITIGALILGYSLLCSRKSAR